MLCDNKISLGVLIDLEQPHDVRMILIKSDNS